MTEPLRDYPFKEWYAPSTSIPNPRVDDFYIPALNRAATYDRGVGYFRSSIFHVTGVAMADFAQRGGRMRVVCSPSLTDEDQEVIRNTGGITESQIVESIRKDLARALDDVAEHAALQLLATLLTHGVLDLRVSYKRDGRGIFHPKIGIISDGTDTMTFSGSVNETYMAWAHNEEELIPFCSWRDGYQQRMVAERIKYFERLWEDKEASVRTVPLPDLTQDELQQHAAPDPLEAIEKVLHISETESVLSTAKSGTATTRTRTLQPHQAEARSNWWREKRGIVRYVTGGGKTFTALEIIKLWFDDQATGSVVVLVPSNLLAKQWRKQLEREEPSLTILQAGGEQSDTSWRTSLNDFTTAARTGSRRVVLAVMHSGASNDFVNRANVGPHTLLVADEVHRIGAEHLRRSLTLEAGGRLGLSATPERYGDEEGTAVIFDYFGENLEPEFTIRDAQKSDPPRLVPYFYRPKVVPLQPDERDNYQKISKQIKQLAGQASSSESPDVKERLKRALIRRARILKSAARKPPFAAELLSEEYEPGDRWLIYCDTRDQLAEVARRLNEAEISSLEYTSAMSFSKEETIRHFEELGGVLLAIECLDEGVDIPSITHALILASSTNPRQHLQRRGRVLRTAPNKSDAMIYDTLVAPDSQAMKVVFDQDLTRAISFAKEAENSGPAGRELGRLRPYTEIEGSPWIEFEDEET